MSLKISLLVKLISFFCLLLNICSISCYSCNLPKDDITIALTLPISSAAICAAPAHSDRQDKSRADLPERDG